MKFLWRLLLIIMVAQAVRLAWAGQLRGELHPEKRTYLVGEPVFVVLDLTNPGSQPVWISMSCVWLDTRFGAPTAPKPHRGVSLFGCMGGGTAGSCGGGAKEICPGEHYTRRYLLDGPFRLDAPGVYPIRAWHKVDIYGDETSYRVVASQEVGRLTKIPGIGKKTAERLLLELRDKLPGAAAALLSSGAEPGPVARNDVLDALLALGYNEREASWAVKQLPANLDVSDSIRQALKFLSKA